MEKNWLIRTKSNHILGPISKEKVVELYQNGSIKPDDEVCSGNGYWFFIREDDMVARFLMGDEVQGFNPISEAKDVLTTGTNSTSSHSRNDDITMVSGFQISGLKEDPTPSNHTDHHDSSEVTSPEVKKKNSSEIVKPKAPSINTKSSLKKQNYLQYFLFLGMIFLVMLVYFRKTIINHFFEGEVTLRSLSLINSAQAQEELPGKKKSF